MYLYIIAQGTLVVNKAYALEDCELPEGRGWIDPEPGGLPSFHPGTEEEEWVSLAKAFNARHTQLQTQHPFLDLLENVHLRCQLQVTGGLPEALLHERF